MFRRNRPASDFDSRPRSAPAAAAARGPRPGQQQLQQDEEEEEIRGLDGLVVLDLSENLITDVGAFEILDALR